MMDDLRVENLAKIRSNRLPGLDTGPDTIHPYYNGLSLYNIPSSISHWLGVSGLCDNPLDETITRTQASNYDKVILLLIDGLGLEWLENFTRLDPERYPGVSFWKQMLSENTVSALTSVSPSTTSAALTTLWTGCSPAEHSVLGYELWLKEYGLIANMITQAPATFSGESGSLKKAGFQPEKFLPVPTISPYFLKNGIKSYAFLHSSIARSGLSSMHMPDTTVVPYYTLSDLWGTLEQLLKDRSNEKAYIYLYWGILDEMIHRFGLYDERAIQEFNIFSLQIQSFFKQLRSHPGERNLWIFTADHGMISTPKNPNYDLSNHPQLSSYLTMVPCSGESRMPFIYLRAHQEEKALEYIRQTWPGKFLALESEKVLQMGLFGNSKIDPHSWDRVGDWIIMAQENAYWWWANKENHLLGRHGGLSSGEMLIPLILRET